MVQEIQYYTSIEEPNIWKSSTQQVTMHTHMSNNTVPHQNYGPGSYNYSTNIYNPSSFPYSNPSMPTISHAPSSDSPQDYQGFSVPSYHIDQNQYLTNQHNIVPSGSSTADSNGSIVSEFDANRNPIKKRRKPAPTIATGRRNLKDENVNTEEADRRDKRRERNRKSAQRCRERKIEKKDALEKQISDTNLTCKKYVELAENVLKAWKQRLHLLNEKLPCNNYKPQLSVNDFENLIEMMHSRSKETSEAGDSCTSMAETNSGIVLSSDYNSLPPPINNSFMTCPKLEPYYPAFNNDNTGGAINHGFSQYHNCIPESNVTYI